MTTITKEFLSAYLNGEIKTLTESEKKEMARMLLAGMEQEPVGYVDAEYVELLRGGHMESCSVYAESFDGCIAVTSAPQLTDAERAELQQYRESASRPVAWLWSNRKHPSEVTLTRPEDDERSESAQWSGWSIQALCVVQQGEPVSQPYKLPDGWVMVPIVPTVEMRRAGIEAATSAMQVIEECPTRHCWAAMIAAAPQQECN